MKEIKSVEIVEITEKIVIYKNGEPANAIEVVHFKYDDGSPCGYNLISQKDLYQVGDKAIYIQPDFCLSDIALFDSFTKPNGDPKKSKLGKNSRIRAVKFNFNFDNTSDPIYSFGILLPVIEVESFLHTTIDKVSDLSEVLGIVKYEEPETGASGMVAGDFPSFMYKTDEDNCFEENQLITTNKGKIKIKDICENIKDYLVLSYNHDLGVTEFKPILTKSINPNNGDWYKITTEDGDEIILTGNHRVFLPELNCYRLVSEINEEDFLYKTDI